MPNTGNFDAYEKGEEAREELKNKARKFAYEIATETEKSSKIKLTFEQFDFIYKKIYKAAMEGYYSATILVFELIPEVFRKYQ